MCWSGYLYLDCVPEELFSVTVTVINTSAAAALLEQRPEKNSGSERDSNPRPVILPSGETENEF